MLNVFVRNAFTNILLKAVTIRTLSTKSDGTKSHVKNKRPKIISTNKKMQREWEKIRSDAKESQPNTESKQYRLLSYNILAQDLLMEHIELYYGIDTQWLKWEHRLNKLTDEIINISPDILCLQEMQYNHLRSLIKRITGQRTLEYVFKKKTGHRTDGCAIIYDSKKFELLEEKTLEYFTPNTVTLNRENIAVMAKFNIKEEPAKRIVVATTHLLYNPRRDDVRMAQAHKLLHALNTFASGGETKTNLPIILTGDFNCEPFSSPYSMLTLKIHSTASTTGASLQMQPVTFGNCSASTFQQQWILVDYILCSVARNRANIKICTVYKLPTVKDCWRTGKIPSKYLGSDHYSLAIDFALT